MTTAPTHPDLLALLRGELGNAEVLDAADHLDQCESCRGELALTATGHALVTSSARTLGLLPPGTEPRAAAAADAEALPPAPDLARFRRQRRRAWVAGGLVAATAATVVWTGGYLVGGGTDERPVAVPTSTSPTRSAVMRPVEGSASGTVLLRDEGTATAVMTIETSDLRPVRPGQFYYAWLLDPATNKMLPLGLVGPRGTASFEVSQALLSAYSTLDVSIEVDDGDPGHSPNSVLRAVLV